MRQQKPLHFSFLCHSTARLPPASRLTLTVSPSHMATARDGDRVSIAGRFFPPLFEFTQLTCVYSNTSTSKLGGTIYLLLKAESSFTFQRLGGLCRYVRNITFALNQIMEIRLPWHALRQFRFQSSIRHSSAAVIGSRSALRPSRPPTRQSCGREASWLSSWWGGKRYTTVSAADLEFGQPVHETHPHILKPGESM